MRLVRETRDMGWQRYRASSPCVRHIVSRIRHKWGAFKGDTADRFGWALYLDGTPYNHDS